MTQNKEFSRLTFLDKFLELTSRSSFITTYKIESISDNTIKAINMDSEKIQLHVWLWPSDCWNCELIQTEGDTNAWFGWCEPRDAKKYGYGWQKLYWDKNDKKFTMFSNAGSSEVPEWTKTHELYKILTDIQEKQIAAKIESRPTANQNAFLQDLAKLKRQILKIPRLQYTQELQALLLRYCR